MSARHAAPLRKGFFNDGPFYLLTSTSLGGSQLSAAAVTDRLMSGERAASEELLRQGVCLPLFFNGDCALDDAVVVVGDLTPSEEAEWIGRIRSKLEIPCGEFMVFAGFDDGFAEALETFESPDPKFVRFSKHQVPPGTYLVELYAFIGSTALVDAWPTKETAKSLAKWWSASHSGRPQPEWIASFDDDRIDEKKYLTNIIRLSAWRDEIVPPPVSKVANDFQWCAELEIRKPHSCPGGVLRDDIVPPEPPAPAPPKPVFKARPRREGYACPLCGIAPLIGAYWKCDCGSVYDTFEVRGVCPTCHKQHETSGCVGCKKSSPHFAFYPKTT